MTHFYMAGEVEYRDIEEIKSENRRLGFWPANKPPEFAMLYTPNEGWAIWRGEGSKDPGIYPVDEGTAEAWLYINEYIPSSTYVVGENGRVSTIKEGTGW